MRPNAATGARNEINNLECYLKEQAALLNKTIENAGKEISSLHERFQGQAGSLQNVSDELTKNTNSIGHALDEHISTVEIASARLNQDAEATTAHLHRELDRLSEVVDRRHEEFRQISGELREGHVHLSGAANQSYQELEKIEKAIEGADKLLQKTAQETVSMLKTLRLEMTDSASTAKTEGISAHETLTFQLSQINEAVSDLADVTSNTVNDLGLGAAKMRETADDASSSLQMVQRNFEVAGRNLSETVNVQSKRILRAGTNLKSEGESLNSALDRTASQLNETLKELSDKSGVIESTTGTAVEQIARAATMILEAAENAGDGAEKSSNHLTEIAAELSHSISQIDETSIHAVSLANTIGDSLKKQANEINQAGTELQKQAEEIEIQAADRRRLSFIHDMTEISDQLGSLSKDLTKIIEKDIPEDVWERYLEGDKTIFARRILRRIIQRKDRKALAAVREMYENDAPFREIINRYISQFQSAIEQAEKSDPDDLLAATMLSSDVGKLYLILSRSLGRIN